MSSVCHTGHRDRHHIGHNRRVGHHDNNHGDYHVGSRRFGAIDLGIAVGPYPGRGRCIARPAESMYCVARSGGPVLPLCGSTYYIRIARPCELETDRSDTVVSGDIRGPSALILNTSCIGGLGESDCPLGEERFARMSSRKPCRAGSDPGRERAL